MKIALIAVVAVFSFWAGSAFTLSGQSESVVPETVSTESAEIVLDSDIMPTESDPVIEPPYSASPDDDTVYYWYRCQDADGHHFHREGRHHQNWRECPYYDQNQNTDQNRYQNQAPSQDQENYYRGGHHGGHGRHGRQN
ncbi:MAG: flagellin [Clostridiales bacterium]|nr:flagellin [Clostridiales bacterium]